MMTIVSSVIRTGALVLCAAQALTFAQQTISSPRQDAARSGAYWTPARKAAAQPMPLRGAAGAPKAALSSDVGLDRTPGVVSGNAPAGSSIDAASRVPLLSGEASPTFGAGSTIWYQYPPPFTLSLPVLDYLFVPLYPNTALGKLFFSSATGNFVCSAQSVTSAGTWGAGNRQTVVTAGHCCSTGTGTFYNNWVFEPAHLNGNAPLGSWPAAAATVFTDWHTASDLSVDLCVLQMFTAGGSNINDTVGALGYTWNRPLPQAYYATGWPAASPFTGGLLYYSAASDAETDTTQAGIVPFTHGIGSSMTGGSSGGAWLLQYQSGVSTNKNLFNGLNSYKYTSPSRPNEMFGPYIDTNFVNLLQAVATAPPAP